MAISENLVSRFATTVNGCGDNPGWFLANNEMCTRQTYTMKQEQARTYDDGTKRWVAGDIYPAFSSSNAIGIVYETIDVTNGPMPGSVVTSGVVYEDRLPYGISEEAKAALEAKGFVFIVEPGVYRPY